MHRGTAGKVIITPKTRSGARGRQPRACFGLVAYRFPARFDTSKVPTRTSTSKSETLNAAGWDTANHGLISDDQATASTRTPHPLPTENLAPRPRTDRRQADPRDGPLRRHLMAHATNDCSMSTARRIHWIGRSCVAFRAALRSSGTLSDPRGIRPSSATPTQLYFMSTGRPSSSHAITSRDHIVQRSMNDAVLSQRL